MIGSKQMAMVGTIDQATSSALDGLMIKRIRRGSASFPPSRLPNRIMAMASPTIAAPKREKDPKKRVVITGMGLVSVFGNDVDRFYEELLQGANGVGFIDRFDTSQHAVKFAAQIPKFCSEGYVDGKSERHIDDCWKYCLVAGKKALEGANLAPQQLRNVMESLEHAMKRGANIIAEYLGGAITCDAHHVTNPRSDGLGVISCITQSLKDAGVSAEEVNYVNAHATSTLAGDVAEIKAIKKVFNDTSEIKMNATKSMIGHCLGAAGGLEAIATIKAITTSWVHPTINQYNLDPEVTIDTVPDVKKQHEISVAISNSFGFGGQNSVVVFAPFQP